MTRGFHQMSNFKIQPLPKTLHISKKTTSLQKNKHQRFLRPHQLLDIPTTFIIDYTPDIPGYNIHIFKNFHKKSFKVGNVSPLGAYSYILHGGHITSLNRLHHSIGRLTLCISWLHMHHKFSRHSWNSL